MTSDAHVHLYDWMTLSGHNPDIPGDFFLCASACEPAEFRWQEEYASKHPGRVFLSFGVHPQDPDESGIAFLEELASARRISAVGESGFDLYGPAFRARLGEQRTVWYAQVSIALDARLPLVIHCRKALHLVFADSKRLSRLPAVVFHGWPGSLREARSFLDRGLNAFFCAGKGLLRGDRSLIETVRGLPGTRLLTETDAPYMRLGNEQFSSPLDIEAVTAEAARLRGVGTREFAKTVGANFSSVFGGYPVS